jgi:hypothetical protein
MTNFTIEASEHSPEVKINEQMGTIEISGNSTLPNPDKFYKHLAKWVYAFNHAQQTTRRVNIKLEKLDGRSSRWIFYLICQIEHIYEQNQELLEINWICNPANDTIVSKGMEYSLNLHIPFNIIAA